MQRSVADRHGLRKRVAPHSLNRKRFSERGPDRSAAAVHASSLSKEDGESLSAP